jgi:hypothetical protein
MQLCASFFITAMNGKVRLIPQESQALPLQLLSSSSKFSLFYEGINFGKEPLLINLHAAV